MSKKKAWLTWLPMSDAAGGPEETLAALNQYGFEVSGDYWVNDLKRVAWMELASKLIDSTGPDLWVIAGRKEDLESEQIRYGLSLASAMVSEERKTKLQGVILGIDFVPEQKDLPTLLDSFSCLSSTDAGWTSQMVALAFQYTSPKTDIDFRFNVIAHPMLGQWFEVGPLGKEWDGAMLGVTGDSSITHHAIGECRQLPEKSVLEFPSEGIQAKLGDDEYTAWSVQNNLGPKQSYFVKVEGYPRSLIIGAHPGSDTAEVVCINLM
jgi:hypothetical protein